MKPLRSDILLILFGAMTLFAGCARQQPAKEPETVELKLPPFGNPAKAEFYAVQLKPQSSNGELVQKYNSAELLYLIPSPLLTSLDIATVRVLTNASDTSLRRVVITVTQAGRGKIQSFIAAHTPDHPIALAWNNKVHYEYPVSSFSTTQPITVADRLFERSALDLQSALR